MVAFSKEIAKEICEVISTSGDGLRKLCKIHKHWPSAKTIFKWAVDYPEFSDHYAKAKNRQAHVWGEELLSIADNKSKDYYIDEKGNVKGNLEHINRSRLRIDTRKWLMCKLLPKVYGDKVGDDKSLDNTLLEKLIDKL